jgi:uncharacterized protein YbjT (DUF2867 family)
MILVTGASGNIGRELARELDATGEEFRLLVRDVKRAAGLAERAERVVGDLADPPTLAPAFAGVEKLFLITPGIGVDLVAFAVAAAKAAGVSAIVHISSFAVVGDPVPAMGRWHCEREEIIRASGISATFLRPGAFMTNALDWAPAIREGGCVINPIGEGRYAPIDPADIAGVAAAALTGDGHQGKAYVLTGGEAFTVAEQVRAIAQAIGRDIRVRDAATSDEAIRSSFPAGAPNALGDAILEGFALMRADTVGFRTDVVERLLGRKPLTFANWCACNADAFRRPGAA